ncbi:MAG: Gfo/Idh/MocA family oxidoreductase [Actinobacteria bacterium]|nr:Gfo/Idh/MocA family oxidoreductase [Candidatus Dormibacteraeota bacterium]MBO0834822.1 Gfo/Idh/MocA family oxidoreductase [Actinomycetota bacterium]
MDLARAEGGAAIRTAVIGCSHWHLDLYLQPLLDSPAAEVVAVEDPDPARAREVAERVGCDAYSDYRELCSRTRPDFVLALGRHCDMPAEAGFLIEEGIPFAMEKPCGVSAAQVEGLAAAARRRSAFAAIPFVMRQSGLHRLLEERLADDRLTNLSLRWIAGTPSRYIEAGCEWMLDPALSGGGCTINLSVHFVDLFRHLAGAEPELAAAVMSNSAHGYEIEDYSLLGMRSGSMTCIAETGYLYPAPSSVFDMRFSIRADRHYLVATGPDRVELTSADGRREVLEVFTTNVHHYPIFIADVLSRVRNGSEPLAGLDDMAAVMRVVERAYGMARPAPVAAPAT